MSTDRILLEASLFSEKGGWSTDVQFLKQCRATVLLAHGLGKPVEDAVTNFNVTKDGVWHIWVRTRNWTARWTDKATPGVFCVRIDDRSVPQQLGTGSGQWHWQYAGALSLQEGIHSLRIHDFKGFDARFSEVYLALEDENGDVAAPDEDIVRQRKELLDLPGKAEDKGNFDLVVAGAGVAGMCAAIAAARKGLKVALIQDRKVLGGNNSSEIRVGLGGRLNIGRFPSLGYLLNEFGPDEKGNARPAETYRDDKKMDAILKEPGITLLTGYRVSGATKKGQAITSITATNTETYEEITVHGQLFADCTGDAELGVLAGADHTMGRESRDTYKEPSAPTSPDGTTLGASMMWYSEDEPEPVTFPDIAWGLDIDESTVQKVRRGQWYWEVGMEDDQIEEAEAIRDYGMYVVYSNWSYIKNRSSFRDEYAKTSLEWLSFNIGKRESRRLLGPLVLNENDLLDFTEYPDGCVSTSWFIDNHEPDPDNAARFPEPWLSRGCLRPLGFYPIPFRCLYSRNIDNLFMAGRDISVSHLALGTTRVMRTCAMMGEAVGLAASVCRCCDCLPSHIIKEHWDQFEAELRHGAGRTDLPYMQTYTLVDTTAARSEEC